MFHLQCHIPLPIIKLFNFVHYCTVILESILFALFDYSNSFVFFSVSEWHECFRFINKIDSFGMVKSMRISCWMLQRKGRESNSNSLVVDMHAMEIMEREGKVVWPDVS